MKPSKPKMHITLSPPTKGTFSASCRRYDSERCFAGWAVIGAEVPHDERLERVSRGGLLFDRSAATERTGESSRGFESFRSVAPSRAFASLSIFARSRIDRRRARLMYVRGDVKVRVFSSKFADSSFSSPQLFVSSPAENDASGHHEARLE